MSTLSLNDINIRTTLQPGDLGWVVHRHGTLYANEYNYGVAFESYVAKGVHEFYQQYDPTLDRVWICEYQEKIVGFLLLMHRPNKAAQLRYFYLEPGYRNIGLGKKLMTLYMEFLLQRGYTSSYLWTTDELPAAAALYQRHGFILKEEVASTAFGKPVREQRYELVIQK